MLNQPKAVPLPKGWTDDDFEEETSTICPACNGSCLTDVQPADPETRALVMNHTGRSTVQGALPGVYRITKCTFCEGSGMVPISKACTTSGFRRAVVGLMR